MSASVRANSSIADLPANSKKEQAILNAIIQRFPSDKELNSAQMKAVLKIQRQARRKNAWTVAQSENQWKVIFYYYYVKQW